MENTWLGGHDIGTEGSWSWSDGSSWSFVNWRENHPNNGGADGNQVGAHGRQGDTGHCGAGLRVHDPGRRVGRRGVRQLEAVHLQEARPGQRRQHRQRRLQLWRGVGHRHHAIYDPLDTSHHTRWTPNLDTHKCYKRVDSGTDGLGWAAAEALCKVTSVQPQYNLSITSVQPLTSV